MYILYIIPKIYLYTHIYTYLYVYCSYVKLLILLDGLHPFCKEVKVSRLPFSYLLQGSTMLPPLLVDLALG